MPKPVRVIPAMYIDWLDPGQSFETTLGYIRLREPLTGKFLTSNVPLCIEMHDGTLFFATREEAEAQSGTPRLVWFWLMHIDDAGRSCEIHLGPARDLIATRVYVTPRSENGPPFTVLHCDEEDREARPANSLHDLNRFVLKSIKQHAKRLSQQQ